MSTWWPWSDPTPAPAVGRVVLTDAGLDALSWRSRCLEADAVLRAAFVRYGRWVPLDVVLDAHNILTPPKPLHLRPAVPPVPVVPGPLYPARPGRWDG